MALDKDWRDRPAALAPAAGETPAQHEARIDAYNTANPGVLTPLNAVALEDLETRARVELAATAVTVAAPTGNAATDTAAIQSALTAAAGGVAQLRLGTYAANATLIVPAGTTLRGLGWGSIISYSGVAEAIRLGSNALTVDDPNTGGGVRNLRVSGTGSGTGIRIRGLTRFAIDDVRIDGFTAGDGIKFHGASFLGRVMGGRIQNCLRGISAKKEAGFGDAGEGMAMNAVEFSGGLEIQSCPTAMEIGDPAVTETGAIVALQCEIHSVTIENNVKGIWNVGGNVINIHDCYMEDNAEFDIRIGSTAGNTSNPVMCVIGGNFINPKVRAIDVVRALHTRIDPNYILGVAADVTTGIALAANAASTITRPQFFNTIDTEYTDAGTANVRETVETDGLKHNKGFRSAATINAGTTVQSYENTSAALMMANLGGQPGLLFGNLQDVTLKRIQAGVLGGATGLQLEAMTVSSAPNNTIFRDSADNVIKVKNNTGVVSAI